MTEEELTASAVAHVKKASIPWTDFLSRVAAGRYTAAQLRNTEWNKAGLNLEAIRRLPAPPTPPTPPGIDLSAVQRMAVIATNTNYVIDRACATGMKVVVCADPVYVNHPDNPLTDVMIRRAYNSPGGLYAWIGPGLSPIVVVDLNARCMQLGCPLRGWYGEGETNEGFAQHVGAAWKPLGVIGNLTQIRENPAQEAQVARGEVLFCWERYCNKPDQRASYSNGGFSKTPEKGFGGFCAAVYGSPSPSDLAVRTPMSWYVDNGAWNPNTDSIYTQGMEYGTQETAADWAVLGA